MDARRLTKECPSVVGMIASTLQAGGSIDTAIRTVSEQGPRNSSELFREAVMAADTKGSESLVTALNSLLENLHSSLSGYRRAIMMTISASESSDESSRDAMLKDASDMALESVKELGESYSASLTMPCMVVFGLGIMVPVIMMSILPMLSVGGMFGAKMLDQKTVVLMTLVVIPTVILAVTILVRDKNPFVSDEPDSEALKLALPLLSVIPIMISLLYIGTEPSRAVLLSFIPACILTALLMIDVIQFERGHCRRENSLMNVIFDLGNRMVSGVNFERASIDSIRSSEECLDISDTLEREYAMCRGDELSAISTTIGPVSKEVSMAMSNIYVCSTKDADDAGRMALTMGRQFQSVTVAKKGMETRLKSMTDMMMGTAMFFAPLVLGLSISMLEPLSRIGGNISLDYTSLILSIYLIELSALISILMTCLGSGDRMYKTVWRFCLICPISLIVFTLCCNLSL